MKANKAPERLYLSRNIYDTFLYQVPDPDDETAVEYTRTDIFIEKAAEWLKKNVTYTHPRKDTEECVVNINAFIEAMKGE